jgi:hypothetical protein
MASRARGDVFCETRVGVSSPRDTVIGATPAVAATSVILTVARRSAAREDTPR